MSFSHGEKREVVIEVLRPLYKQLREMNNEEYPWREIPSEPLWIEANSTTLQYCIDNLQRFYQLRKTINDIKINFNEKYPTAQRLTDGECGYDHLEEEREREREKQKEQYRKERLKRLNDLF
tara:strand:- start:390 stop:755 length:366 start_codon:yes stop_codon:yes gene_type:complete